METCRATGQTWECCAFSVCRIPALPVWQYFVLIPERVKFPAVLQSEKQLFCSNSVGV